MKFKIDENLPVELAEFLIRRGNDTHTVYDEGIAGAKDEVISLKCKEENRILITLDQDFSDIRTYPPESFPGIVVLRLKNQDKASTQHLNSRISKTSFGLLKRTG